MIKKELNSVLQHDGKKPIVYDLYYQEKENPQPLVIFCHGYKGFKDWGAWHLVAEAFAEAGFVFLKFNFSHNGGTVEEPIDFPDLEAFAENNYSLELEDLQRVLDTVSANELSISIDMERISLIGHSRGGGIVLIKAEEHENIHKVITWAGVSDYKVRFNMGSEEFQEWKDSGVKYVQNGRTKQQMPHHFQFYKDFEANEERLTIRRAAENLNIPQLIIHGKDDPTVDQSEAEALHRWNPNSKLILVEDANHVFNTKHPWENHRISKAFTEPIQHSISFLKQ
ncbi:dienelactone hydrolase family protein [Flavobacteriaceae bacterium TK19130]|nr:dienelactone hydrolase family protein [Thermobacterium salinum]